MTVLIDDPLIAGMAIRRTLPLHESSRRLRELYPECPRVYGVAVMGDLSRRRWWPLAEAVDDRSPADDVRASPPRRPTAGRRWPSSWPPRWPTSSSAASCRCSCSRAAPGTPAWRTSGCTSTPRARSTGSASSTRQLRALPDDPASGLRRRAHGIVALPSEAALTTWVAHRSHRALEPLFARLFDVMRRRHVGRVDVAHRRRRRGQRRDAGAAAGRVERADEHAPRRRRCSTRWSDSGCRSAAPAG